MFYLHLLPVGFVISIVSLLFALFDWNLPLLAFLGKLILFTFLMMCIFAVFSDRIKNTKIFETEKSSKDKVTTIIKEIFYIIFCCVALLACIGRRNCFSCWDFSY